MDAALAELVSAGRLAADAARERAADPEIFDRLLRGGGTAPSLAVLR
jgi:hypothetical protein